jgi:site-specific recombinase XerC
VGAPGYINDQYRGVQALFKWLEFEGEIDRNITVGMLPPAVGEKVVPIVPEDGTSMLFKSCAGRDFVDRRGLAILERIAVCQMVVGAARALDWISIRISFGTHLVTGISLADAHLGQSERARQPAACQQSLHFSSRCQQR